MLTDILDTCCAEPEWLILNENLTKYLEFGLWDSFREGISAHMAGTCPCTFPDLDKLMSLYNKAIGRQKYLYLDKYNKCMVVTHIIGSYFYEELHQF